MDYQQTLSYLYTQLPMYQRIGKAAYKADLNNTLSLLRILGNPEKGLRCIHVAGTNGKGSVSHLIASVLQSSGYRTGLYTSPHLLDFRERIRVDGKPVPEDYVVSFVEKYRARFEEIKPSFFEWSVGLALDYFSDQKTDISVIETGMGGRLDSTNVITPEICVITNVAYDHQEFLGSTLAEIAEEKAGIIKPGVPVVIGRSNRMSDGVFRKKALENDSPITFADQLFPFDVPPCPLGGTYQTENFQTALTCINTLRDIGWDIPDDAVKRGFEDVEENTGLRGRWEIVARTPLTICDIGHNEDGLKFICQQLENTPHTGLHMVVGFTADKRGKNLLRLLPKDAHYYLCCAEMPRAMPIDQLIAEANQCDLHFTSHESVSEAYQAALEKSLDTDVIFIGGSTFVVADFLRYIE